jgi:glycosyltransferase involved in cell wall biosynthesis
MPLFERRITVGVAANEFFDPALGQTGGFGWAARRLGSLFRDDPSLGVDVVFLSGQHWSKRGETVIQTNGIPLLVQQGLKYRYRALSAAWRQKIDILLTIDYRSTYDYWLWTLPRTPVIVWSRDPRSDEDIARVQTLRIPGRESELPLGIGTMDCTGLGRLARRSRLLGRRVIVADKMPHTAAKAPGTYDLPPSAYVLPNPDLFEYGSVPIRKAERPLAIFVGRLDPIKRPWLFFELARRMPHVEFVVLGRAHYDGPGSWQPDDPPTNLRMLGQMDGARKLELLASAWVLVNTSIHEETPVSVLEGFACEVPVLSCTDWGDLAARFGVFAGRFGGTGLDALPALEAGMQKLLGDHEARLTLGRSARNWVEGYHNTERFLAAFRVLCRDAGVRGIGAVPDIDTAAETSPPVAVP